MITLPLIGMLFSSFSNARFVAFQGKLTFLESIISYLKPILYTLDKLDGNKMKSDMFTYDSWVFLGTLEINMKLKSYGHLKYTKVEKIYVMSHTCSRMHDYSIWYFMPFQKRDEIKCLKCPIRCFDKVFSTGRNGEIDKLTICVWLNL